MTANTEEFSEESWRIIDLARKEARHVNHKYVGAEHRLEPLWPDVAVSNRESSDVNLMHLKPILHGFKSGGWRSPGEQTDEPFAPDSVKG